MTTALESKLLPLSAPALHAQSVRSHVWRVLGLLTVVVAAERAWAVSCHGAAMPARIVAGDAELPLRGMGLREATWLNVDVYVAGLYVSERTHDAAAVLAPDTPKQMRLALLRDVGRTLQLRHGSRVLGSLPGGDFARTLFAIWLGDPPLDPVLRAALLGAPCND